MKYFGSLFILLFCFNPMSGQIGKSLVLNGCTDFLEIPETDLLDYNDVLSIECWIFPNCDDGNRIIVGKEWCVGEMSYYLSVNEGRLFWRFSAGGECTSGISSIQSVDEVIQSDEFTHVAVVHGQSEVNLFVNGISVATQYTQGFFRPIHNSNQEFRIGAYKSIPGSISNYFSGLIDEIRLWDIPLTEGMIQSNMNTPLNGNENGLILYLDMESTQSGSGVSLPNIANISENLTATSVGFTSTTPYFDFPVDYFINPLNFEEQYIICDEELILIIGINDYKSILWSTGSQSNSSTITNSGTYSVTIERELCKYFSQDIEVILLEEVYEEENVYICAEDTYEFQGQLIPPNTSEEFILLGMDGCDTTLTINVFELPDEELSFLGNDIVTCNSPVFALSTFENTAWNTGHIGSMLWVDEDGEYIATATDELGCTFVDTINVSFNLPFVEITVEICKDDLYPFQGQLLEANSSSTFIVSYPEVCDTTFLINVLELPSQVPSFLGDDIITCNIAIIVVSPFENTTWSTGYVGSELWVDEEGEYYATAIDEYGCTYSDTINVSIELPFEEITVEICKDDLYPFNGQLLEANSSSTFIIENAVGCDSTIKINVLEIPPQETSFLGNDIITCESSISLMSPYENTIWDGEILGPELIVALDGIYYATAIDDLGCVFTDSITVTIELPFKEITVEICKDDLYPFNGQLFEANTSSTFLVSYPDGCDTSFLINVLEKPAQEISFLGEDILSCENSISLISPFENTIWNGDNIGTTLFTETGGTYYASATDDLGCVYNDSIMVSFESNTKELTVTVCKDEFYEFYGELIPPNSTSTINVANQTGCDSIFTVYVNEHESQKVFEANTISICQEEIKLSSPFDSTIWNNEYVGSEYVVNTEGSYNIQAIDRNGCIVVDTIYIEINSSNFYLPNVISINSTVNNCFKPIFSNAQLHTYSLKVFDRWGNKLYANQGTDIAWCGYYNNKPVANGVYVFILELENVCGDTTEKIGTITVL